MLDILDILICGWGMVSGGCPVKSLFAFFWCLFYTSICTLDVSFCLALFNIFSICLSKRKEKKKKEKTTEIWAGMNIFRVGGAIVGLNSSRGDFF